MKKSYFTSSGFTLMEVLITIVIIGVLAGLAVPMYQSTVEEARSNEAKANLQVIYLAEKIFQLDNSEYYPKASGTETDYTNINKFLKADLSQQYYTLKIVASGGATSTGYVATAATRVGNATKYYTINQANPPARLDQSGNSW